MDGFRSDNVNAKKVRRATTRPFTVGLYMLRVKQLGLSFAELDEITCGDVYDMIIEQGNDNEKYPYKATQRDFDAFRGG